MTHKYLVKAWNVGNYTTTITSKYFPTLDLAMQHTKLCYRTKVQIVDLSLNPAVVVWDSK